MNTPKPCSSCGFLYVDCMTEDDPDAGVECLKGLDINYGGDYMECIGYKHYEEVTQEEKWKA